MSYDEFKIGIKKLILKEIEDKNKSLMEEIGVQCENLHQAIQRTLIQEKLEPQSFIKISESIHKYLEKMDTLNSRLIKNEYIPQAFLDYYYQFALEIGLADNKKHESIQLKHKHENK